MSGNGADEKQYPVDQFWHKYLFILEKSPIPVKPGPVTEFMLKHTWPPILVSNLRPTSLRISTSINMQKADSDACNYGVFDKLLTR